MNTIEFVNNLRKLNIKLFLEGDRLRCKAPEGILTPALKSEISDRKAEIISFLQQANLQSNTTAIAPISRIENKAFPLSFSQQRLWFLYQLQPESPFYNIPLNLHFSGQLNSAALESSLQLLINRHEILRTNFITIDGRPAQVINAIRNFSLSAVDLRSLSTSERDLEYQKLVSIAASYVFNLSEEDLLWAKLVQLTPTENVLLLTIHHIIFDGWSINVFLQEFTTIYSVLVKKNQPNLPQINLQYVDFAMWQQQCLQGEVLESQLAYWQKKLTGMPALLELRTDRPRPAVQSFRGETQVFTIEPEISEALICLSQKQEVTLFMLLLTAFKVLLYRYTNQPDIVVGSTVANRQNTQIQGMLGFFVNTLVLRTDLSNNPTFLELLQQVKKVVLEAYDHQEFPFDKLVEALHPERNLSHSPLFQIDFSLEHEAISAINLENLTITISNPETNHTAKFDLSLSLQKTEQVLIGGFEYSTDLFNATTITRMIEHWQTLLAGIVANPQQRLSDLPILTAIEQHKLLVEWNQTQQDYPKTLCIYQLFEAQVEQTPDAIAVTFKDEQLTYRELNTKANQLAHHLQALGVKPETLVGICVERSFEMIVGILGILKAGGAYVPIDPAYPSERIAYMLDDSQLPVLLTQKQLVASLPKDRARVLCLDSDWEEISKGSELSPITSVTPENLAYVIYTSGSTGKPKGVTIQHRSLVNYIHAVTIEYQIEKSDRILQFSSVSFDVSAEEIYTSLTSGATLVLRTDSMLDSFERFLQKCQNWEISVMALPTAYWHELTAFLNQKTLALPPSLRLVILGGEKALPERLKTWFECVGQQVRLLNNYGPTEATIGATIYELSADDTALRELPIGRPLGNVCTYILDRYLQPVPIGVPGELHIASVGLARGYLNRPYLTQQKFIPNPFSNQASDCLYKTGDLARYLPDGNIEFMSRIDNQVKIRGFRIELGEIETTISQHPSVKQTVVIATENNIANKQLVAYIVPELQAEFSSSDLRNCLKQKLPDYMIPAVFIMLESLPLTPNGKIDTKALPKPETAHQQLATTRVLPQTSTQKILASIWAEVLQLQEVGIHNNFFELGGDSIISIQIVARCHQAHLHFTVKDLFQHQTIAELAQIVTTTKEVKAEQGLVMGIIPLTPILHWFTEQNLPEPHHFNQSFLFEISPDIKPEILQQVFQELLLHHDALRLHLIPNGDTWQLINALVEESEIFRIIDLSKIGQSEQISAIETTANQLQASLNLSDGPVLRVALFHLGNQQSNRLLIIIHHLTVDGVSWRILLEDLSVAYQQLSQNKTIQLPAKTTSFQNWAIRLNEYAQSQTALAELDYWLSQLDSKIAPLPVDYPAEIGENKIADTAEISVCLSAEQTTALLKEVPKAYNTQINDVLLTALVQSFAQWTGQNSLLIDLEGHGREELFADINLSRTVGWFTSVFPVLLKLEQAEFPGKLLKAIKEQLRRIPQRGIGYGILRYLSEDKTTRHQLQQLPQAQICFNYLGQFDQMVSEFPILGLSKESSGSPVGLKGNRSHLLDINGFVTDGKLQLNWAYNTKLHSESTIEQLANSFIEALSEIIDHCLSPEAFGYTPTDFPDAKLTQAELDELVESLTLRTQIESIYPLSPMQEGMLFYTLYAPNSGVYFEQLAFTLSGNLNISAWEQAWRRVVELHPILRTFFVCKNRQHPLQVVCKSVNLPWQIYDWRSLEKTKQKEQLESFLQTERERGFELDKAPLMCCTLIQLADDRYQFVWSHHHALMDGWCLPIVLKEVWTFYEAFNQGENLYLEAPPPYRNYIAWLRQQDSEAAKKFWRSQLAGFTAPTPLMVDKSVGDLSKQQDTYDEQGINLSAQLTEALSSLARQHHLTLNILMQGAWALLLSRYSGESDVVFGATVSGRPPALSGVESMVGLFINTLPVRVQVSAETELLSWLQQLQVSQVEREQYSHSPLVEIQGQSDVTRNLQLFNSIVVFENYPVDSSLLESQGSIEIKNIGGFEKTNYPLTVGVVPGNELSIQISYDANRFDNHIVSRMLGHLESLLLEIATNPNGRIGELPLLTDREKQQLLVEWNNTATEYPFDKCIQQLFEEQVERTPDSVSVVFEGEQLTYRELNAKANQLAHYLRTLGVEPEVLVGICMERSLEMVVGLLGILKAGGAYVPVDPGYPSERLAFMLEDSSVPVLLTQSKLVKKLPSFSARVVCLDFNWEEIAVHSKDNPSTPVNPENLAYVIYTSGSTGKPKGVLIEHKSLVNYTTAASTEYQIEKSDRILQFSSISFDVSAEEIYTSLTSGATLVLRTDSMLDSVGTFWQKCIDWKLTVLILPTAYWHELTVFLSQEKFVLPQSLRLIIIGGEKALRDRMSTWLLCVGQQVHLVNNYGPTEATVGATMYELSATHTTFRELPIGRPICNVQTYILDRYLQPVPIGIPGELHIGGVGLARGYFNRPDLTQEKFIVNPFSNKPNDRLYKTGDLARYLPDGNIEYLGRIDNQVKIRGFRIELGEIEAALTQHPDVREVVVICREDTPSNKGLAAYVVSKLIPERIPYHSECQLELDGNTITVHTEDISIGGVGLVGLPAIDRGKDIRLYLQLPGEEESRWLSGTVVWSRLPQAGICFHVTPSEQAQIEQSITYQLEAQNLWKTLQRILSSSLRDYLKQKLPNYMIPSAFVLMKALPLTPNGKIDRRSLPAPETPVGKWQDNFVPPTTSTQTRLTAIWIEVLGLQQVSINDNFFELGGHSLLATSVISRIHQAFSVELPLRYLFEAPTIASLSKAIETACLLKLQAQSSEEVAFDALPPLVPVARDTYIPLSISQKFIWYSQQSKPDSCRYNSGGALRLTGAISPQILEQSINEIVRRHEILRTTFPLLSGQPVQAIANQLTVPLKVVDLQDLPLAEREASAQKLAAEEFLYHFDLASGPLIKTTLLQLAPQEHWLLIPLHHIIVDGWSFGLFIQELGTLYHAFSNNLPSFGTTAPLQSLPDLPVQYADFTLWERQLLNSETIEKQLDYWQQKLADIPRSLDFRTIQESSSSINLKSKASSYSIVLPEDVVASLNSLSRWQGTTLFTILLTALKILLFKWSGQSDILVAATIGNRSTPEIETLLGCFINDVIVYSKVDANLIATAFIEQVDRTLREAINHKDVPFQKVIESFRNNAQVLPISAGMVMAPPMQMGEGLLECEISVPMEPELWHEQVPLEFAINYSARDSKTLEIGCVYSIDLFTHQTIEHLFSYYQKILQKLVESPETKLSFFEWPESEGD